MEKIQDFGDIEIFVKEKKNEKIVLSGWIEY